MLSTGFRLVFTSTNHYIIDLSLDMLLKAASFGSEAFDYFLWPTSGPTKTPYITHYEGLEDNQVACAWLLEKDCQDKMKVSIRTQPHMLYIIILSAVESLSQLEQFSSYVYYVL